MQCRDNTQCKAGEACSAGVCLAAACTADSQCAAGESCLNGACRACRIDSECGVGGKCDGGRCQRATACTADDQCQDDEDCVDGYCQRAWQQAAASATCALSPVYFALDDSSISIPAREVLTANNACLAKQAGEVIVAGHTDPTGTEEYNIALSHRRGQSVADYLSRLGIAVSRLHVVPRGETEPSGQGEDKDRRVEFQWK